MGKKSQRIDRTLNNGRDKAMHISDRGNGRYKGPEAGAKAWNKETRRFHLCSEGRVEEMKSEREGARWGDGDSLYIALWTRIDLCTDYRKKYI